LAIEESRWILQIEDDFDGEGGQSYQEDTWRRATDFLQRHSKSAALRFGRPLSAPQINPADSGSIDLFWEGQGYQLLVNFPSTDAQASFFGSDDSGESLGGTVHPGSIYPELISWLLRHE
jgi:hypothetical protein